MSTQSPDENINTVDSLDDQIEVVNDLNATSQPTSRVAEAPEADPNDDDQFDTTGRTEGGVEEKYSAAPTAPTVTLRHEVYFSEIPTALKEGSYPLVLLPKRVSRVSEKVSSWNLTREDSKDQKLALAVQEYFYASSQSLANSFHDGRGFYEGALDNPESKWENELRYNDEEIHFHRPNFAGGDKKRSLVGFAARDRIAAALGTGLSNRVLLPHSGFFVTLRARSRGDYLALDTKVNLDAGKAGHDSVGLIFQNSHFGKVERVFEFITDSVSAANIQGYSDLDLGDYIRVTDLPILYNGQATTMFPDGHPLDLPCSNDPKVCGRIETVNLDLTRIVWFNQSQISKDQREHLGNLTTNYTPKDIVEYQQKGLSPFTKTLTLKAGINQDIDVNIRLKVPTVNEYISAGRAWVRDAKNALETILKDGYEMDEKGQRDYIQEHLDRSSLREYSHWIDRLHIGKDYYIESESIHTALEELSAVDSIMAEIFKEIQTFIESVTVAIVAIPNFSCKCGYDYSTDENSKHPELVPIDPLKLFFASMARRLTRLQAMPTS